MKATLATLSFVGLALAYPSRAGTWSYPVQAWIYPGSPACDAAAEYADGRVIDTLKPEYYTVENKGTLRQIITAVDGCNAFNQANIADVKAHSIHQYITVSSEYAGMGRLLGSASLQRAAASTLISFAMTTDVTGIELDWEKYSRWNAADYSRYKEFVNDLARQLRACGKKLIIDGPPIANDSEQETYLWKYEDFESSAVDYLTVLAYDYQYDWGAGQPVAPDAWVSATVRWVKARLSDDTRIIVGMPSYGYHGETGSYRINIDTFAESKARIGFTSARIGPSAEFYFTAGGVTSVYQATSSMDQQRALIEALGPIGGVSVWHLGGNNWFSAANSEPSTVVSSPTTTLGP